MPLINCKIELKRKWTKHCVLSVLGNDNPNVNSNNIIFIIKDTKLYVHVVTVHVLSKEFERSVYWNENKTKNENKNSINEYKYFL